MEWARAKDWLIGALGMILVLGVVVGILWWAASEPADGLGAGPEPSSVGPERPPGVEAPADLRKDEVWLADLTLDAGTVVTPESLLRDVRAVGQDVVTGPDGLIAARLVVDATVPFEVVADDLGDGTVIHADDGQAVLTRTVETLGRELRVVATGTVEVEDGRLVIEPRSIDIGPDLLSGAVAAAVRRFVTVDHEIEGLPEGLVLQDVIVWNDGFRANLRGEDVRLQPRPASP